MYGNRLRRATALGLVLVLFASVGACASTTTALEESFPPEKRIFSYINNNNIEGLKLLLQQGVDPQAQPNFQWAPIFHAAWLGKVDAVRVMLDSGASPNFRQKAKVRDRLLEIPILTQVLGDLYRLGPNQRKLPPSKRRLSDPDDWRRIAELLIERGVDTNALFDWGRVNRTYLSLVTEFNDLDMAKRLVEKGADVNLPRNSDDAPLFYAAKNGNVEMAKFLLDRGADMYAKAPVFEGSTITPIEKAAVHSPEVAALFIDRGANPNGGSLFFYAIADKRNKLLHKLLSNGANVNVLFRDWETKQEDSDSPLLKATTWNNSFAVKALLDADADVCKRDSLGQTPYDVARKNKYDEILMLLEKRHPQSRCSQAVSR